MEWVSVNDMLPSDNERVIVYIPMESYESAYKYVVMWGWSLKVHLRHSGITHWMPFLEPPKENNNENG